MTITVEQRVKAAANYRPCHKCGKSILNPTMHQKYCAVCGPQIKIEQKRNRSHKRWTDPEIRDRSNQRRREKYRRDREAIAAMPPPVTPPNGRHKIMRVFTCIDCGSDFEHSRKKERCEPCRLARHRQQKSDWFMKKYHGDPAYRAKINADSQRSGKIRRERRQEELRAKLRAERYKSALV